MLDRVFELRKEVLQFLHSKNEDLAKHFSDPTFNIGLAYLSDIFGKLNDVNLSIQGAKVTIIDASESVSAFKEKLLLWKKRIVKGSAACFSNLDSVLENDYNQPLSEAMKKDVVDHLDALNENFERYFDKQPIHSTWFRDPFFANLDNEDDTDLVEELIEIRSKSLLKDKFF